MRGCIGVHDHNNIIIMCSVRGMEACAYYGDYSNHNYKDYSYDWCIL